MGWYRIRNASTSLHFLESLPPRISRNSVQKSELWAPGKRKRERKGREKDAQFWGGAPRSLNLSKAARRWRVSDVMLKLSRGVKPGSPTRQTKKKTQTERKKKKKKKKQKKKRKKKKKTNQPHTPTKPKKKKKKRKKKKTTQTKKKNRSTYARGPEINEVLFGGILPLDRRGKRGEE